MNDTIQYDPNKDHFEIVIVGAGAAGAMMAHRFAAAGKKVVILEAGPRFGDPEDETNGGGERPHPSNIGLEYHLDRYYAANAKVPSAPWRAEKAADRPTVLELDQHWKDNRERYVIQKGPLPFPSTYERLSGGTANHWLGTTLRLIPSDFHLHTKYGVTHAQDWPITYQDLEPWYTQAERELNVSGDSVAWQGYLGATRSQDYEMTAISMSYLDQYVSNKVQGHQINQKEVTVRSTPQARNSDWSWNEDDHGFYDYRPPCMGNSSCIPICPVRAKYDPSVHLNRAIGMTYNENGYYDSDGRNVVKQPAEIRYQAVAYQVMIDAATDRVSGILYKQYQSVKMPSGERGYDVTEHRVTGDIYVVCAHAIETAKLLLNSAWKQDENGKTVTVANSSDQVGRNLMDHTILLSWALVKETEPVYPFRGPLSTSGIGEFRDGEERRERAAYIIEIGNDGWAWPENAPFGTLYDLIQQRRARGEVWYGTQLRQVLHDHVVRQIRIAAEFESLPNPDNRVQLSEYRDALGIPKPELHYDLSPYTQRGFADAVKTLNEIWAKMEATEVHIPVDMPPSPSRPWAFVHDGKRYEYRGAGHIMGTSRMGHDKTISVVDQDCRTHDHENLYLVGSSVFPSTGTANPTLTIVALAIRAAEHILQTRLP
ncbi:MAG: hypothetical protein ETSY1_11225 [Candidatus Entotheonella factor]|uniref:Glucose-methanol-choline oxidoreductase C-terminal domain-containing protein n=1 Tax=Entotheonella factor TaxID=1429438 RepID=W4LRU1_ENTF1|nr:GMC family oxidoreductase [Candidatus Entotheonella palauensis]ETX00441.1 MAG: hypothetical protein ETSY1_11225 [Candidatus Entotheonella factor]